MDMKGRETHPSEVSRFRGKREGQGRKGVSTNMVDRASSTSPSDERNASPA